MTEPVPPMWSFGLMANYGYEYWNQRPDGRIILGMYWVYIYIYVYIIMHACVYERVYI